MATQISQSGWALNEFVKHRLPSRSAAQRAFSLSFRSLSVMQRYSPAPTSDQPWVSGPRVGGAANLAAQNPRIFARGCRAGRGIAGA